MESDADWTQSASADFGGSGFVGKHRKGAKGKHNAASGRIGGNRESSRGWTASKSADTSKSGYKDARPAPLPPPPKFTGQDRRSGGGASGASGRRS